jgi:16S rRNA (uracil1498-N3)-methyltransferase
MRRRFFVDRFESNSAALRGDAAEHLGRVLRAEPGQLYELSDGQRVWLAKIERVALSKRGDNRIEFVFVEPLPARAPRLQIELLLSLVKFDRFEWCIEKATELGASTITPLAAARTDKPLVAAAPKRLARWEKIALESAQQSRRLAPPILCLPLAPEKAFSASSADLKILLSERADAPTLRVILQGSLAGRSGIYPEQSRGSSDVKTLQGEGAFAVSASRSDREAPEDSAAIAVALAIGPEGGWTESEIAAARAAGFVEASLGENILRTETAVLAAMAILSFALDA